MMSHSISIVRPTQSQPRLRLTVLDNFIYNYTIIGKSIIDGIKTVM